MIDAKCRQTISSSLWRGARRQTASRGYALPAGGCPSAPLRTPRLHRATPFGSRLNEREGAALIGVMAVTLVATLILAVALRSAVRQHRQLEIRARAVQSHWLAESAVERAVARLASDDEYPGETWRISNAQLGRPDAAFVEILVEKLEDRPQHRSIEVRADYPDDPLRRVRRSKRVIVDLERVGAAK